MLAEVFMCLTKRSRALGSLLPSFKAFAQALANLSAACGCSFINLELSTPPPRTAQASGLPSMYLAITPLSSLRPTP